MSELKDRLIISAFTAEEMGHIAYDQFCLLLGCHIVQEPKCPGQSGVVTLMVCPPAHFDQDEMKPAEIRIRQSLLAKTNRFLTKEMCSSWEIKPGPGGPEKRIKV